MKCEKIQNNLVDYIESNLSEKKTTAMVTHIKTCENCRVALIEMQDFLTVIPTNEIEQPSEKLRLNFEQMLANEKKSQQTEIVKLKTNWKPYLQIAATILLVFSSFLFGRYQNTQQLDNQISDLKNKNIASKQTTILALLDNQSASKRIQGVQYLEEFSNLDPEIIEALLKRMLHDENTNVRLTAVNALQSFIVSEKVKNGFIKALEKEKDPAIQITLIQSLVNIQAKRALKPMQQLLEQDETQPFVKDEIKIALSNII